MLYRIVFDQFYKTQFDTFISVDMYCHVNVMFKPNVITNVYLYVYLTDIGDAYKRPVLYSQATCIPPTCMFALPDCPTTPTE
jgi:hypothetical protein